MKRFVFAFTLACALSATALAGEVPTTGIAPPPPEPPVTSPGNVPTSDCAESDLVAVLLSILSSAL